MDETILKKMNLSEGMDVCIQHPYAEFDLFMQNQQLVHIVNKEADFVLVFVRNRNELSERIEEAKKARKKLGKLWIAYPKATATLKPDLNRDSLFQLTQAYGLLINGNFALDENWSLLRTKDM